MDVNKIIEEYKDWSKNIDPITLIQSIKKYYCLNNENCCLIVFNYMEIILTGNYYINKIMKIIIKRLNNILFDYNFFYTRNIPIYIFFIQHDILFNYLLKNSNYDYDLLLNNIEFINDEKYNNITENKIYNILSFVYNKYNYLSIEELNNKMNLLKNNQRKNIINNLFNNNNDNKIKNDILNFCKKNNIKKMLKDLFYIDINFNYNDIIKLTYFYYKQLININNNNNIKVFTNNDILALSLSLLYIYNNKTLYNKYGNKINNYIVKFINNLINPTSFFNRNLYFYFYLLYYYCKLTNLIINYNNFNIIINYDNIKSIYDISHIFFHNLYNIPYYFKTYKINKEDKNKKVDYIIFCDYNKISNKKICNINKLFNKYFKDDYYYYTSNLFYYDIHYDIKDFINYIIKNKSLNEYLITKEEYNKYNKLFINIDKITNEELNKIFNLCFMTYKNTNYDFQYNGLQLFLQKRYNINIINNNIRNEIINEIYYLNNNILHYINIIVVNDLLLKNIKNILKTSDCIIEIKLSYYENNKIDNFGHSCKLYFDHKYKEIYFFMPEGNTNKFHYNILIDKYELLFKDLNYKFIKDKFYFLGFQRFKLINYNYDDIFGYCVSISLFLCHMYYLLKDKLHKYYNPNEFHIILHKILYENIKKLTINSKTNKNMYMKFFNNYNSLLGNFQYLEYNIYDVYIMKEYNLFDYNMFNYNYNNICKILDNK